MEVRQATNSTGDKQIIVIGLNKFDINQLRQPGSTAALISISDNTMMAVCRVDAHIGADSVLDQMVKKLNDECDRRKESEL